MSMKQWMADFRIESRLTLAPQSRELNAKIGDYEFFLQDASPDDPAGESIAAQVKLAAEDLKSAESASLEAMRYFLDLLSFSTGFGFRIRRRRFVMDWSPGLEVREALAYGHASDTDDRWPELEGVYLDTAREIAECENLKQFRSAMHWYGAGLRSTIAEDQFQYFWFVLELIAEITKGKELVADKCQRCGSDLFCNSCNSVSQHRPFVKQGIESIMDRLKVSKERQRDLFTIRNGLMHGDTRDEIELKIRRESPDVEFADAVDFLAGCAFMAIFNSLKMRQSKVDRLVFGERDSVVTRGVTMTAHIKTGMYGDKNDPRIENVVLPKIDAVRVDKQGCPIDERGDRT
jgi:hypothetical protein